jgi:hypothetical protein
MDIENKKHKKSLQTIAFLSKWMDNKFTIPGTQIKFGLDPLLSLIPGIGGVISATINTFILGLILIKGVPFRIALQMFANVMVDSFISFVPVLGTVGDLMFQANTKNLSLLENHLNNNPNGKYSYGAITLLLFVLLVIFGVIILASYILYKLLLFMDAQIALM